jgi:asparagine synthase (glutamine-hydrolysing)
MCGIAGFFTAGGFASDDEESLTRMARALKHRGPDDEGFWIDADAGVAFCHRRLSIIDLSPLGHQPMASAQGRFTITFNGEIYNYEEMRAHLLTLGHSFRGASDTEVLLASLEEWGIEDTLRRARGMFAFAAWDRRERVLHLARDRFGEKPLYYADVNGTLLFGSELKALRAHRAWSGTVDREALASFLRYGYFPAPRSVYSGVRKAMPGSVVTVKANGRSLQIQERPYWEPSAIQRDPLNAADRSERLERVHAALADAIRLQMVADVPVGAFLSGGIDSSLIVSLMQRASRMPVRTFSIGFTEERYNEAPYAKAVANHLGTQHTELIVTPADALAVIPRLAEVYDEPLADSSQVPTMLVCALARRDVTVALSGDAGDELFGGYRRYEEVPSRWQSMQRWPAAWRRAAAHMVDSVPQRALETLLAPAGLLRGRPDLADRMRQHAGAWHSRSFGEFSRSVTSIWPRPDDCVIGAKESLDAPEAGDGLGHMMYSDTRSYLPDDILMKVDRAAMAVSLETRVPFLDPHVAAAAWSIDSATHRADGRGKWVLRELLARHVPRELFERPKKGFAIPMGAWLRTDLRGWAEELLRPERLRTQGFFDARLVRRRWDQHQSGRTDWSYQLWGVLTFQSWLEHATDHTSFRFSEARPVAAQPISSGQASGYA